MAQLAPQAQRGAAGSTFDKHLPDQRALSGQFLALRGVVAKIAQGNAPGKPEGYFDGTRWHGHAWVVTQDTRPDTGQGTGQGTEDGLILDLTADQFGGPKTVIAPYNQLHQYRAGRSDTATNAAKARRQILVTEVMKPITSR
jgi:hypothetical protein